MRTADAPPGEVAEADFGRLGVITESHPVRTPTCRKSSVTGEMVCPLPTQRAPALSLQLTSEQSAMRRDEPPSRRHSDAQSPITHLRRI